jgi:hypothetical protein
MVCQADILSADVCEVCERSALWSADALLSGRSVPRSRALVAKHREQRVEIGVGAQHEHAVEPDVFIRLIAIEGKVAIIHDLDEAAIAGSAYQCLVAALQLSLQSGDERRGS